MRIPACFFLAGVAALAGSAFADDPGPSEAKSGVTPFAVPTFHCLGVYWSPEGGEAGKQVLLRFRERGQRSWRDGLPMRHHPVDTPECKADYRGSIVDLKPGTSYEVSLRLEGTETQAMLESATWSESFPVGAAVKTESRDGTLEIEDSGTPEGYVLYDGTGCTIDTGNKSDVGIAVRASYVIVRGFRIRNVREHGIRLFGGHHIVIEDCDISRWGSEDEKGFGKNYQACVFSNNRDLRSVVIQRCRMHHPSWDSNSWAEQHGKSTHPAGPQTVVFWESEGNHVIRYNECWSDPDHYFNDGMGAGYNGGYRGFPGADSDIYCNYIAHCWDDGIEAEGGDQNVRIWSNYIEEVLIPIANAAASIGPLYAWRNVTGRCYSPPGSSWSMTHGPAFKMGFAGGEQWMTGHMYLFHNTILQPSDEGAGGLGGSSRIIKHCVTRNNVLHVRTSDSHSISTGKSVDNDFDYDLLSARYPDGQEAHGIRGRPRYAEGAGLDLETKTGSFQLAPESPGYDDGVVIPNFSDVFTGAAPDMGAHEAGTAPLEFGVKARFVPPGSSP